MPMMAAKMINFGQVILRPPKSLWRKFWWGLDVLVDFLVDLEVVFPFPELFLADLFVVML